MRVQLPHNAAKRPYNHGGNAIQKMGIILTEKEFNIEQTIGFSLHHASYLFKTALKTAFQQGGYSATVEEFVMLNLIPDAGAEQSSLRERSLKDKTNVTRLLDRMAAKGWINRTQQQENRRQQVVSLTAEGKQMQGVLVELARINMGKATAGLSREQIEVTCQTLQQLSNNIR